jgi:hypothetical protein
MHEIRDKRPVDAGFFAGIERDSRAVPQTGPSEQGRTGTGHASRLEAHLNHRPRL